MQNIVEVLRNEAVNKLFSTNVFSQCFSTWNSKINELTVNKTPSQIINLGDNLSEIFTTTNSGQRGQSDVSGGGSAWEGLICWYLNLCLIGRRTVVIKHNKNLIPIPVSDAITVNYNNFISNTESDLVAITFPDKPEYNCNPLDINILDENGEAVPVMQRNKCNLIPLLNALCHRDFSDIEIHIIQCKTNWNDNAQIPMLWNMIYSAERFKGNITVGRNGYSIKNVKNFTYSFATVPTSRLCGIKPNATCVKRVNQLSGGNYWGMSSVNNVASSIKEMLSRNLSTGGQNNHLSSLREEIPYLNEKYIYFKL